MHIIATNTKHPDVSAVTAAATALRVGEVIAYLTDTLYGLGGDSRSILAIERIFLLKGRSTEKALPVIVGEKQMAQCYVEKIPSIAEILIEQFWPGPLTIVFNASANVPANLMSNTGKIAMRLPASRLAREISNGLGAPVISTSANRSGEPVLNSAKEIADVFGKSIALILDSGPPMNHNPSTIIDVTTQPPRLLRAGAVPLTEITKRIGELSS